MALHLIEVLVEKITEESVKKKVSFLLFSKHNGAELVENKSVSYSSLNTMELSWWNTSQFLTLL